MNFDQTPIDFNQPFLPQLKQWFFSLLEAPYSASVSNLLLVILAVVLVTTGVLVSWIATHPAQFRRVILSGRERSSVRRAERYLRCALAFLLRRFDVVGTYTLSFTIALGALFLGIWFFGSVLEDLLAYNGTARFDVPIADFIAAHRIAWLITVMHATSLLASAGAVTIVALGAAVFLRPRGHGWRLPFFLLVVVAGASILDLATGYLIVRPRPLSAAMIVSATDYNFLIGQTAVSVLYGALAYLVAASRSTWQGKVFIWSGAVLVVFLVGVSRIYLGTDWLTDILSRSALALVWLSAALVVAAIIEQSSGATAAPPAEEPTLDVPATEASPEPPSIQDVRRSEVSIDGLGKSEVAERRGRGEVNIFKERTSRSVAEILRANLFTRFNALLGGLFVVILLISGKQDALFGLVLVANTAIGVVQELRAKRALDRLKVLVAPRTHVVRGGAVQDLPADEIVIDDVLECHPGDQVPIDGVLLAAQNLEVNESLLTGEAEPIAKSRGELVLSGSFIVAGSGRLQTVQIGEASYARRLALAARKFTLSQSQLRRDINDILRYVTWALIPTAILLFITQLLFSPAGAHDAAVSSIAGIVGMVPEGLVLLMSTVMAVAVIRLAGYGALVQELAAVELLARVDVICADKTGTLTEGRSTLEEIVPASVAADHSPTPLSANVRDVLGAFAHDDTSPTASSIALRDACPRPTGSEWTVVASVPFSSTRKWSVLTFASRGTWILGAPEIVLKNVDQAAQLLASVDELAKRGKRVLALVSSGEPLDAAVEALALPTSLHPAALIVLGEKVRADVADTIRYFEEQGVAVKVISGDHAETVQAVAALAGVHSGQQAFDGRNLPADPTEFGKVVDQYSLFGRVTPAQKLRIVQAIQANGHVVAMIGDGINDVLAIKQADFGIALGSGTAASRAVAQLILLKDNFSALPSVIAEGRGVIANVERTANLFLTKTVYVFALALAIGIAQAPFPFLPRHLTLVSFITIGVPGLFLAFARNMTVARPGFVSRVLRFAFPAGAIAAAATLLSYAATRVLVPNDIGLARTAATLALVGCGLIILWLLARPRGVWHWLLLAALSAVLLAIIALPPLRDFFALQLPPLSVWAAIIVIEAIAAVTFLVTERSNVTEPRQDRAPLR